MKINTEQLTVIKPESGWKIIDFKELKEYRDLFIFMVWREIKILYAQTIMGFSWSIFQPLLQIIVFTIVFGNVAKVPSDGIPYFLFSTVAIIPWSYMSMAITQSSSSLVNGQYMLGKIYFPRLIYPITPVLARLLDFGISILIIIGVMIYYRVALTWNILYFPFFVLLMIAISTGIGMWLSSMTIRFRDVRHAMPFIIRMLIYSAPIVYSASSIPEAYRFIYSLNPIVGVIEGFRASLLGLPMPWFYIWPGVITTFILLISGAVYFKRMEKIFVDVI